MPHHSGFGGKIGAASKRLAPTISRLLLYPPAATALRYITMYLDVIQGKGSGAGWDLESEAVIARSLIRSSYPIIFDIGAHSGSWSKAMLRVFAPHCHIYQFEPAKQNLVQLRKEQSDNTTLIEKAVSEKPGTAAFYSAHTASDTSSLYRRRESIFQDHEYFSEIVEVTTIDEVIEEFDLDTVHFLKMDIEGHELAALKGAEKALSGHRIKALTFEFGSGNINSRTFFHDFWDLLVPLGYSIWRICPGGVLLPIKEYYEDLEYFRNVTNYVAALEE